MKMIKKLFGVMLGVIALAACSLPLSKTTASAEDVVDITDNVSASGWITQSELKVTYLNLGDNVVPTSISYGMIDNAAYTYAQDYIAINGKTVKEINTDESLGAKDWTYTVFPSSADVKYKLPIMLYVNNGLIEIKLHSEYLAMLGDSVEITAKEGLYFENGGTRYEVTADKTFTVWSQAKVEVVDITEIVSVQGWAATGDKAEMTYARVTFAEGMLPESIDYGILDKFDWTYLQEYILFNGKTLKEINEGTDTSNYQFYTFPSTADVKYKLPIIIFENNNALELKFHNSYLQTAGDSLEITIKEGLQIVNGNKKYVVSKDITYLLSGNVWADKNRVYTITYFVNGEQYGEPEQRPYNSPLNLRDDVQTEAGFVFSGWEYTPTEGVIQNMEIHGYIRPIRYKVTYHLNGGVNHSNNPIVYYVTDGEIVLKDATKENAVFKGWYTSEDYTQKVEKLPMEELGNVELYALFEETEEKGCGSTTTLGGAVGLVGLVFLFKKRKNNI